MTQYCARDDISSRLIKQVYLTCLAAVALVGAALSCAQVAPAPDEVQMGPVDVTQEIQGVPVTIPVTGFVSIQTAPTGITVAMRTFANLQDLQAKIGSIVDTVALPRDNCRSFSANNPVVSIYTKKLTVDGASAVMTMAGDVDLWDCRENPIPNSKLEWVEESWLGVEVRRPKIATWPGSPIKNKLLTQPVTAMLSASLTVPTDTTVQVVMGSPKVELGGQAALAAVRDALLNLFRVDVNAIAERALRAAIDPNKLAIAEPEELRKLNLKVTKATFVNLGSLGVEIDSKSVLSNAALTDLLKALAEHNAPSK
jgi:hypothetical protein